MRLGKELRVLPDAEVVAAFDIDADNRREAGRTFDLGPERLFDEYVAMLDGADLDAVVVGTPNGLHYEQANAALDRDLHVLLEKPIATDVGDALALTERVEATDRVVMLGYQRHLNPAFAAGRERWALGDAEPTFITGELTHDWREYFAEMDDWRMDPELSGGGHLLNVGIHVIEAILWMTGLTPTRVDAEVEFVDDDLVIDTQSSLRIRFADGTTATVTDTGVVPRAREQIHVWDDEGALYVEGREWNDRTSYTIDVDGTEHDPYRGGVPGKAEAFVETVETGGPPPSTARDALWATAVTMAAYESGRRGEPVELTELYPDLDGFGR